MRAGTGDNTAKPKAKKQSARERALARFSKTLAKYVHMPTVHSGLYILDFGCIVKGMQVTKRFRVQNISTQVATPTVDRALLEAYGCVIEPQKLPKLNGAPDFSSAEIALTMQTNVAHVFPGPVNFFIPIDIRSCPPVIVSVRANVIVPEFICSHDILDFGNVQVGMSKVYTIRLTNPKPVPCTWDLKKPVEAMQCTNWTFYR